jgi:REP element-mobilizing transposase RayT
VNRALDLTFRKHLRVAGFDYRDNHAYFVTICTGSRACIFGSVVDGEVQLSQRGHVVHACWQDLPNHHAFVELDAFVVMPNHVHAVICFVGNDPVAATPASRSPRSGESSLPHGPVSRSLSAVVGSFKSSVSRNINRLRPGAAQSLWQPNFYEHVIRNDYAFDRIREYIVTNPSRWDHDSENPEGDGTDSHAAFIDRLTTEVDSRLRRERDAGVAATEKIDASKDTK